MVRILLTSPTPARGLYYPEEAIAGLRALGDLRLNQSDAALEGERLIEAARDRDVIVSDRTSHGPAALFAALPGLVAFVRCAVDIRNVDAASAAGVLVTRASPGFIDAVAEWIVGAMIELGRGLTAGTIDYRAGRAPKIAMGRQLAGSALGVIGYGAIGRRLVELGQALKMTVLVADPHARVERPGVAQVALPELLARADFVVCLAIANESTENLMDAATFARMKPSAFFVNPSRGGLVDEAALEAALREGRIAGAALDVGRARDQMPSPVLAALQGVIATPHVGGLTAPATSHQALETVRQVAEILNGRVPAGAVNADRATRLARLAA